MFICIVYIRRRRRGAVAARNTALPHYTAGLMRITLCFSQDHGLFYIYKRKGNGYYVEESNVRKLCSSLSIIFIYREGRHENPSNIGAIHTHAYIYNQIKRSITWRLPIFV